jgi:hypothetical protein
MSGLKDINDAANGQGGQGTAGGGVPDSNKTTAAPPPSLPEAGTIAEAAPDKPEADAAAAKRILQPGETASFVVPSQSEAFHTGINLEANAQYTFKIAPDAVWQDWHMPACGPLGYKSPT